MGNLVFLYASIVYMSSKILHFIILGSLMFGFGIKSHAQSDSIPVVIADIFYMQYPYATDAVAKEKKNVIAVDFKMKGENYHAYYKDGNWRYTLMDYAFERLSKKVQQSFKESKYGGIEIGETKVVYFSGGYEEYRIKLKGGNINNKYVYLSESGKIVRPSYIE